MFISCVWKGRGSIESTILCLLEYFTLPEWSSIAVHGTVLLSEELARRYVYVVGTGANFPRE